jgi:glycosyltransferase involved in cell wall biosynthesis
MPRMSRVRIGFISAKDPRDIRALSGIPHFMAQALRENCGDVVFLRAEAKTARFFGRVLNKVSVLTAGKRYNFQHSLLFAWSCAKKIERQVKKEKLDVLFATRASSRIAFLKTKIPIIYTSDTTHKLMEGFYDGFSNLLKVSRIEGNLLERLSIQKASKVFYPSKWAADSAIKDYGIDPGKISIIPSGANISKDDVPPREEVLSKYAKEVCRLLFLGVDWERKGGEIAFETLLALNNKGLNTELVVCGCTPPDKFAHERMKVIPFLSKFDPSQKRELMGLLSSSSFLLLPTRADTFGLVFCEANAYGLPVIATDTGGVSGAVTNGRNGYLLPLAARGGEYARLIKEIYRDDGRYNALVRSSRSEFEERLNWDAWARKVNGLIEEVCARHDRVEGMNSGTSLVV